MKAKKNVLLITYYWPPSGGAGVHRWLRFSKYFKENNCNLTVYCPENAAWPIIDHELSKRIPEDVQIIRRGIFEPHKYLSRKNNTGVGFTEKKKQSLIKKLIIWIRGNLFIPDSRVFWIKPSIRFLTNYLKEHPEIDTIISTGPPHSMHLIALGLKKRLELKWIADFRDPWTQIDFYDDLLPSKWADWKHKKLEAQCLKTADEVVTVSSSCATGLQEISERNIHVITNGYDFPEFDETTIQLDQKFTISHLGSMPFTRNPLVLWKALKILIEKSKVLKKDLSVELIGSVDYKVIESAKDCGVDEFITLREPVTHSQSIELQRKSQLLLLVANNSGNVKGILTGKFFEYLGAKRPILAIGEKHSDLDAVFQETQCGQFVAFDDVDTMVKSIEQLYVLYQKKILTQKAINLEQFNSKELAKKMIELI